VAELCCSRDLRLCKSIRKEALLCIRNYFLTVHCLCNRNKIIHNKEHNNKIMLYNAEKKKKKVQHIQHTDKITYSRIYSFLHKGSFKKIILMLIIL
jgi:hypothetical protein